MALAIALTTGACASKTENPKTADVKSDITDFEVRQTVKSLERTYVGEGTEAVYDDTISVYSTVRMAIEWPSVMGSNDIKVLQDSLIKAIFDTTGVSIDAAMLASAARPEGFDQFRMKQVDSIPGDVRAMTYTRDKIASVITFSPGFVVYQIMTATYDGGAHGMTESRYLNYDLNAGKVIDYGSAFKPGSEEALLQAVKDNLMTQYNASSIKELSGRGIFTDQIYVSKNFYLQGYDVVFHYNPYDIAPYSEGSVDVRVPYFQISDYLTQEVTSLLADNNF